MLNLNKHTQKLNVDLNQHSSLITAHMCARIIVHNCRTQHSTEQNSSDYFPSYPPDSHHSADDVYWRAGGNTVLMAIFHVNPCYPVAHLKLNSITLAGSKLVRSWSQTGSKLVGDQLRNSFKPASVMEFGFYCSSCSE